MNGFSDLDKLTRYALKELRQFVFFPTLQCDGKNMRLIADEMASYHILLTLKNTDGASRDLAGQYLEKCKISFDEESKRFCFSGVTEETKFSITFEDPQAEISFFNPCNSTFCFDSPWNHLWQLAVAILQKEKLSKKYCNKQEKALIPLLKEICVFTGWHRFDKDKPFLFCQTKKLLERHGHKKTMKLFEKAEKIPPCEKKFEKISKKIMAALSKKAFAPLWKDIHGQILESQAEYPQQPVALCDQELLQSTRREIQSLMEEKGYSGTYPDFVKNGRIKGVRLINVRGMTYFVHNEKRVRSLIHCQEQFDTSEGLSVQFLCGTAFLKKNKQDADIYDCMFDAGPRRLIETVNHLIPVTPQKDTPLDDLGVSVSIATKKAECKKLTKEERALFYNGMLSRKALFWRLFLLYGGLFALGFTAMMFLFANITFMFENAFSFSALLTFIKDTTWVWIGIFAFGWIGFGTSMAAIDTLACRK